MRVARTGHGVSATRGLLSTSQFLLPVHLIEEVLRAQKEVIDFATLFVTLCGVVHTQLGLLREELADVGHGEDDLLHSAVQAHDLSNNHRLHMSQNTMKKS